MKKRIKQYGNAAVMCLCLLCCTVLLASVATGKPLVKACETHAPILRTAETVPTADRPQIVPKIQPEQTGSAAPFSNGGFLLTEADLEGQLLSFLPPELGSDAVDVTMEQGLLGITLSADRNGLKKCLTGGESGLYQALLFRLLPRRLELVARFAVSADEQGLHLTPVSARLGKKELRTEQLPAGAFSMIDEGLRALLAAAGVQFREAEVLEEGLLLR